MIRILGKVTHTDGRVADFAGGINALSMWEAYAQRQNLNPNPEVSPMTWTMYVAYASLPDDARKGIGFDTWKATIDDVDIEVQDANPTHADTSDA